jgi:hypothetical protein
MHTIEPFFRESSASEVEVATGKPKSCKSASANQTPAELIHAGGEKLLAEIHEPIKLIWNKQELPHQWKESPVIHIQKRVMKLTVVIIEACYCCQTVTKFYPTSFSLG